MFEYLKDFNKLRSDGIFSDCLLIKICMCHNIWSEICFHYNILHVTRTADRILNNCKLPEITDIYQKEPENFESLNWLRLVRDARFV